MKSVFLTAISVAAIAIFACKKESGNTNLKIRMTDAPAAWEEVNVDLKAVNIKMANDSSSWVSMNTRPGIYNLLDLQNGVDTLIAEGVVPQGNVKEIRLVLGSNNTIKANGQVYPLVVPSGSESGLKIKISKRLSNSLDSLLIDFDAGLSVRQENDGYKLRPVIRLK